jgi:hypothetical protein
MMLVCFFILFPVAAQALGVKAAAIVNFQALSLVMLYSSLLIVAKFAPGGCFYRLVVLAEPEKHVAPELRRAQDFAVFAGRRILFAGLILMLVNIATAFAASPDLRAIDPATVGCVPPAFCALLLYASIEGAAKAAYQAVGR